MSSALNLNLVRGQILQITCHLPSSLAALLSGSINTCNFYYGQVGETDKNGKPDKNGTENLDFETISLVDANYKG